MTSEPVRPEGAAELARLAQAGREHPYVAWRDAAGTLQVHGLGRRAPALVGRLQGTVTFPGHGGISREHAEITLREHAQPQARCVFLLDAGSKHGTECRPVRLRGGVAVDTGVWQPAPQSPGRPLQLDAGDHDVRLAREAYLLVGGVPLDEGRTADRDELPEPTARQRDVLVELCRPLFEAPDPYVPPASNAEIAARVQPPIGAERVSDHLSDLYRRYGLTGTNQQNRLQLAHLARRHLLDAGDYR